MTIALNKLYRGIAALIVATVAWFGLTLPAAAAGQSVTISPTSIDEMVQAGKSTQGTLQVINTGSEAYSFKVYATSYSVSGETYRQNFTPVMGMSDISSWFQFTSTTLQAAPGHTTNVPYVINVPAGTAPGGYYAAVFAEPQASSTPSGSGVVLHERVGTIFYLKVSGAVLSQGSVASWVVAALQGHSVVANLRLTNSGNVHFLSTDHMTVSDIFGHTKYTLTTAREVLPRTTRLVQLQWNNPPPLGLYKVSGSASFLGQSHSLPTRYVLEVAPWIWVVLAAIIVVPVSWFVGRRHAKSAGRHA